MNRLAPETLVEKTTGGKGGGGARLTAAGQLAVSDFWRLVKHFQTWMGKQQAQGD
jgi:molybdate transport system regulatory protein